MNITEALRILNDKFTNWLHDLIRMLPNILLATLIFVLGIFIAGRLKKLAFKISKRFSNNVTLVQLFAAVIHVFMVGIVLFTVLSVLKLDKAVTSILAGAGIMGLALAFAFQDIAANFISGIFISFRRPLHVGDIVQIGNYMGKVEEINLRDTVLRTFQGQMVIVPNKTVFQNPIENFSLLGKRRIDLEVGVSYGDDLEKVRKVALAAVKHLPHLSKDDETSLFFRTFGDSSINCLIRIWINTPEQVNFLETSSEAIIQIKKAFDANDIMIPFPISTMDFNIKGGTPLNDMLNAK